MNYFSNPLFIHHYPKNYSRFQAILKPVDFVWNLKVNASKVIPYICDMDLNIRAVLACQWT